jgi:hypothetical protein
MERAATSASAFRIHWEGSVLKRQSSLSRLSQRGLALAVLVTLTSWLGWAESPDIAFAQTSYNDLSTAEGWAWSKISRGEWADFNQRCESKPQRLDAKVEDARWQDDCRKLSVSFLKDLLTKAPWRESTPFAGVRIKGARIATDQTDPADFDLENAKLIRSVQINGSRVDAAINLVHAQTDYFISFDSSKMSNALNAEGLRSSNHLSLVDSWVLGTVNLHDAKIDGKVEMRDARVDGVLDATALRVDGSLNMSSQTERKASFKDVYMSGAKIGGNLELVGAYFDGVLDAPSLQVGGDVLMQKASIFAKKVNLAGAKISGSLDVSDATFDDMLDAQYLHVGGNVSMKNTRFARAVDMAFAKVSGPMGMIHATFDGRLNAYYLQVDGNLSMQTASFADGVNIGFANISGVIDMNNASLGGKLDAYALQTGGYLSMHKAHFIDEVNMGFARFGNNLDLRDAVFAGLDLSGASIAGDLQLGSQNNFANWKTKDGKDSILNLRNAHVGNLTDEEEAWPKKDHLILNGASFDHLGGHEGETERDMLKRGAAWWDEHWAKLNPQYSPSPYSQLAADFTALGDRENANEIRYLARERERAVAWDDGKWGTWLFLSLLKYVAGYGIGLHTFRVVYWVLGVSVVGAILLWRTVPAAASEYKNKPGGPDRIRGLLWCFGASLNRLLPIIELHEFKGIFEDPDKAGFKLWQRNAFSILSLVGWILGGVLILAISGLTQNT